MVAIVLAIELAPRLPRWLTGPLEATGQLALTIYVAHVLVGLGTPEAMGRLEGQSPTFAVSAALLFTLAS